MRATKFDPDRSSQSSPSRPNGEPEPHELADAAPASAPRPAPPRAPGPTFRSTLPSPARPRPEPFRQNLHVQYGPAPPNEIRTPPPRFRRDPGPPPQEIRPPRHP